MEIIAEINDLACRSIELGDYQIAIDALETCLECVKQLRKCQSPTITESTTDDAVVPTKENIARTLRAAKRTILEHTKKHNKGNKRTRNSSPTSSQKRQRQSHINPFPSSMTYMHRGRSSHTTDQESFRLKRCQENEEQYFIYCKPIRLSAFQWARIAIHRRQNGEKKASKRGEQLQRHIELAISANLVFNIALSHHLLTSSRAVPIPRLSTDDEDDIESSHNDNGVFRHTNTFQTKERLRGALRLYEIGFRLYTKRMALIMATQTQFRRRSYPDFSSLLSISSSLPTMEGHERMRQVSLSANEIRVRRQGRQISGNGELTETIRFALALLNNCAHIHSVLGQHEKAKVFHKRLLSFFLEIIDSGASIHDIIGDDPTLEGYLKNVYDGAVFDQKVAPAAMA